MQGLLHGSKAVCWVYHLRDVLWSLQDYVNIMEFLIKHWKIESMQGLSVEAQKAQEDVLGLLTRYKRLTERQAGLNKKKKTVGSPFSWVFNHEIPVLP